MSPDLFCYLLSILILKAEHPLNFIVIALLVDIKIVQFVCGLKIKIIFSVFSFGVIF